MAESLSDIGARESDFDLTPESEQVVFRPNHALMARPRLREKDMLPQRIFFYTRLSDNKLMVYTEQEAALMMKSSHAPILKQIGCSDGKKYTQFIRECGVKPGEIIPKSRAQEILDGALNAEVEAAKGNFSRPQDQNVHFDDSFPIDQRATFVPPK
jgi:hypothetical protein